MTKITARNRTNRTVQFYLPGSRYMQIAPHGSCTLERVDCQSPTLQKLIREGVISAAESSEVVPSVTEATEIELVSTAPIAVAETAPSDMPSPITITPREAPQTIGTEESISEGPEANATASSPADRT